MQNETKLASVDFECFVLHLPPWFFWGLKLAFKDLRHSFSASERIEF